MEEGAGSGRPREFSLEAAWPNPFNASVHIPFALGQAGTPVQLTIHDLSGRTVRTLTGPAAAGRHVLHWDGRDESGEPVGNGTYLVHLRAGGQRASGKVMLVK